MNMITYASPIALRPQRKYALGLYVQSLTYQHVKETGRAVLQVCWRELLFIRVGSQLEIEHGSISRQDSFHNEKAAF